MSEAARHASVQLRCLAAALALLLMALPWRAGATAEVVLTVHLPGVPEPRRLDMDALLALPQASFRTTTVWTEGENLYSGVMLADLLGHLGVDLPRFDGAIAVAAIDGYVARVPAALVTPDGPLLAIRRNNAPMPVRQQGPIWLLFPFDADARLRIESVLALAVWQVREIRVEAAVPGRSRQDDP